MDTKNLNIIDSSKYDIYTKYLDLLANSDYVTDTIGDFNKIDLLSSGTIGYETEAFAMIARDSAFHKMMIYRDSFLNTAEMPKSIYNYAKMYNVNVLDAVPAGRYVTLSISTDDIDKGILNSKDNVKTYKEKYGITENGNFIVINKENPIIANDLYYSLEHSVEIYKKDGINQYIIKYCVNEKEKTTSFGYYNNPIIYYKIITSDEGSSYIEFSVLVFQYKTVEHSKIITSSSFLDTRIHQFEYSGQICGLTLKYIKGNSEEDVNLEFSNIDTLNDTSEERDVKCAYYNIIDDTTLEINFESNSYTGLPQSGSTLILKEFITNGIEGNVSYSGDACLVLSETDFKTIAIAVKFNSQLYTSGANQSSLNTIKQKIMKTLSLRETIITENDLNIWFNSQSKNLENVNNSQITFRKEKDNIIRRTFAAYLLLRDGAKLNSYLNDSNAELIKSQSSYISNLVPTNTIDIDISTTTDNDITISPSTYSIAYNPSSMRYECGDINNNSSTDYTYVSPFTIHINSKFNTVTYFYLDTSSTTSLLVDSTSELLNTSYSITPLYANVNRDSNSKKLSFNFYFSCPDTIPSKTDVVFTHGVDYITIKDVNIELTSENKYKVTLTFEDNPDLISLDDSEAKILMNYNDASSNNAIPVKFSEYESIQIKLNELGISFKSNSKLNIFNSLEDIMSSDLTIKKIDDKTTYILKDVPVVAKYWYNSKLNSSWFIEQLLTYIKMLKENVDRLETTTYFNIKFRNTYGISQRFTNTNVTNIRLKLNIILKEGLTLSENERTSLENEIRDYIRTDVDNANNDDMLSVSKIIMKVQAQYYDYIDHIDFMGLNGTFNQYIKKAIISTSNDIKYPLEYFALDCTIEDGVSRLVKDITFN